MTPVDNAKNDTGSIWRVHTARANAHGILAQKKGDNV